MDPQDLKAWRAKHNLTQEAAANALGIGRRTLVTYEQEGAEVPRIVALACAHLDEHTDLIAIAGSDLDAMVAAATREPRGLSAVEVAYAGTLLAQTTLEHLVLLKVMSGAEAAGICRQAARTHEESGFGKSPGIASYLNALGSKFWPA